MNNEQIPMFDKTILSLNREDRFALLYNEAFDWETDDEIKTIKYGLELLDINIKELNILDVGAGSGRFLKLITFFGNTYTGLEPNLGFYKLLIQKRIPAKMFFHNCLLQNFQANATYNVIMLMTDTVSYLYPYNILSKSMEKINHLQKNNDICIMDLGLFIGSYNCAENWVAEKSNYKINASYESTTFESETRYRNENLTFDYVSFQSPIRIYDNKNSLVHHFSIYEIVNIMNFYGYVLVLCIEPATLTPLQESEFVNKNRLLLFFKKKSDFFLKNVPLLVSKKLILN